jgi:2'-hydroxyisoflavone reductase
VKILLIGGTRFLGRHIVESARSRGHTVTLFHRGQTNPALFPDVERITGDRRHDLQRLQGAAWDAVVDTCGYFPDDVRHATELLRATVPLYAFISTISVYASFAEPTIDESAPLAGLPAEPATEITAATYGPLKVLCEQAVQENYGEQSLIIRPGLIVGPHDPTDRFTYWPVRMARGGDVLAPDNPDLPVQFIDGRDLAEWIIRMLEASQSGIYNATGPNSPISMGEFLVEASLVAGTPVQMHWVDEAFLLEHEVVPFQQLPLWVPSASRGLMQIDCSRAVAAGLTTRPVDATIAATLAWHQGRGAPELVAGLEAGMESKLLATYQQSAP